MLYTHLAAALLGAAIAGSGAWRVQTWRHAQIELERVEHQAEVERMRRQANQGVSERAHKQRTALAAALLAAGAESGRLRDELAWHTQRAAAGPGADGAAALALELFGECRERRQALAREAGGLAAQVAGLQDYAQRVCLGASEP